MTLPNTHQLNVLIAGGGVAGLEAALALRDLAGERVSLTLLTPEPEFVYRPLRVREPFAGPAARHYVLQGIADDLGLRLIQDTFKALDCERQEVLTEAGQRLSYNALLLALGARQHPRFRHALTIDDRRLDEQLHGLIQDVEEGYARKLAFIAPARMAWPLPLYELALLTARRAYDMYDEATITLVTPELAPLAVFGDAASTVVSDLLVRNRVMFISSSHVETPRAGQVLLAPGGHSLYAERIVALPELFGPSTPGVPKRDGHGFITVDAHCRVVGSETVFAAGDATDFPVKHGGVAAQQADVAAEAIAALAGAPVTPTKFAPVLRGMLLGGDRPMYLSAHLTDGYGSRSQVSDQPIWLPDAKVAAKYLSPYLETRDRVAVR